MALDNILYVSTASIAVGTITDASGVGLVPSASHALVADSLLGTVTTADTASYVAGANVDGVVSSATSASHALIADTVNSYRAGQKQYYDFGGSPLTCSVVFEKPFPFESAIAVSIVSGDNRGWTAEDVNSGSFIISSNSTQELNLTGTVYWIAVGCTESVA